MNNSKKLLKMPLATIPKPLVTTLIVLAIIGFGVSTYLTVEHLRGELPGCSVLKGCASVLTSKYATIGPIPTAAFGVGYYLAIILLGMLYIDTNKTFIIKTVGLLTLVGFIESLYFVYLQLSVIGAICLYCMTSAIVCTLLFLINLVIWKKYLRKQDSNEITTANKLN